MHGLAPKNVSENDLGIFLSSVVFLESWSGLETPRDQAVLGGTGLGLAEMVVLTSVRS